MLKKLHYWYLMASLMTTLIEDDPNSYFCFSHGELASCWYVLLSGAVFIQVSFMMRRLVKVNHR